MKVIKAFKTIDNYFIGSDEGSISDRIWFYGTYSACLLIVSLIIFN